MGRETACLGVMRVLSGIVEGRGSEIVLVPRRRDALLECRRRRGPNVFMGFGEVGRLHGVVSVESRACSRSCGVQNVCEDELHVNACHDGRQGCGPLHADHTVGTPLLTPGRHQHELPAEAEFQHPRPS